MSKKNKVQELEDYIDILHDALVAQQEISSEYYEMLVQAVDCYDLMMFGLHRGWIETSVAAQGMVDFLGPFNVGANIDILRKVLIERPCPQNNEDDMVAFFDALVAEELGVQAAGADDVVDPFSFTDLSGEEMVEFLPGIRDFDAPTMADVMFRPFQDLFGPGFEDRGDDDPDWCDEDGCGCGV